jgi:hypothetical protein
VPIPPWLMEQLADHFRMSQRQRDNLGKVVLYS